MSYRNDNVSDVMAVLAAMRNEFKRTAYYRNAAELRKEAVADVADKECRAKRYKNKDSALKTIHDACARRLKPDVSNKMNFDTLADQWLRQNTSILKHILLKHSKNQSQRAEVTDFFGDKS